MNQSALRWVIVGLLFMTAVLNYVDKNTLALLKPTMQKAEELNFDDQAYAHVLNAFQVAYTVALLASGIIVDRLGTRAGLGLFVAWWSLANMLTGWARSVTSLGVFRFLLGLGEAGNWTASPKAVAEWFPPSERGLAIGIYTAGTPIGMTLAPVFIIWLNSAYGWRSTFVVTGLLGLVWIVPWLLVYRRPSQLADGEREEGRGEKGEEKQEDAQEVDRLSSPLSPLPSSPSWFSAFGRVEVWCLLVGRMLTDAVWFFYQNWYPTYLVDVRDRTQEDVKITWVMFLAAGVGSVVGGWVAGRFIKKGGDPVRVRLWVMLACALVMPLSPLVATTATVAWSLAFASIIAFAHLAWLINISTLVVDVTPERSVGTVFGIVAAGSSLGAIAMNYIVAALLRPDPVTKLVQPDAYYTWYVIAAFLHFAALPLVAWGLLRKSRTHSEDLPQ